MSRVWDFLKKCLSNRDFFNTFPVKRPISESAFAIKDPPLGSGAAETSDLTKELTMDDKTLARKIEKIEKDRKRWMTRLTIAHNKVAKFDRQLRALKGKQAYNSLKVKVDEATVTALPQPALMP